MDVYNNGTRFNGTSFDGTSFGGQEEEVILQHDNYWSLDYERHSFYKRVSYRLSIKAPEHYLLLTVVSG